ncbi:MAG: enoyl-CoA hydratase/isomerase family protein [Burkholderiales bacterium]|nr:enoyl-CoA hydratase/isomerase family protein [Burkholderiales bacterium]
MKTKRYRTLETETVHGVALVWMNRPDVRNAFNEEMISELTDAFATVDRDPGLRAMVLAARGSAFCAGADLHWMKKMAGYSLEENYADAMGLANMLATLAAVRKPTVARVHGAAFAGGIGLVAACDIAVAAHEVEFSLSEVKLGLIPATIGPYVVAAMGERAARRYMLTAERFTAAEAYRIGLVQEIALPEELDGTVNAILGHLVSAGPHAVAATKDLIRAVSGRPIDARLREDTAKRIAKVRASAEGKEGVRAFLEKRKPAWLEAAEKPRAAATRRTRRSAGGR